MVLVVVRLENGRLGIINKDCWDVDEAILTTKFHVCLHDDICQCNRTLDNNTCCLFGDALCNDTKARFTGVFYVLCKQYLLFLLFCKKVNTRFSVDSLRSMNMNANSALFFASSRNCSDSCSMF